MASPACCSGIVGNSDLVGIGTRINLYITILLSAIIIPPKDAQGRPKEGPTTDLLDDLFANSIFYGLAVLITALVQTIQKQLDLYHAIFVSQVLICLVILHLYGAKRYITRRDSPDSEPSSKFKWNITIAFQVLQVLIFVPWVLYIWVKDSRFGSQPECNHFVKYVFFFATVRATVSWLRILVFISLALCAVALVFVLVMALKLQQYLNDLFQRGSPERRTGFFGAISNALDSVSNVLERVSRRLGGVSGAIVGVYARMAGASSAVIGAIGSLFPDPNGRREQYLNRLKARWWRRLDIAGKVFWVVSLLAAIYSVVTMELIVHRNHPIIRRDSSENQWGFGQIASIILILPIIIDVLALRFDGDKPQDAASGNPPAQLSEKQALSDSSYQHPL